VKKTDSERYLLDKVIENLSNSEKIGHKVPSWFLKAYCSLK